MCGIAGFIDYNKDVLKKDYVLHEMIDSLAPRGPDVSGTWVSHNAALGHRRLIVVDPLGGSQPMTVSLGGDTYTIIYNGEIYNTKELRNELILNGHNFSSHSDTEVLLAAYIEWGPAALEKLNGIFAFAIWEEKYQRLFLARDRMGVKPLFYSLKDNSIVFASEIKALLIHDNISSDVNKEGLCEIFALAPARSPEKTAFKDIQSLRPAECMMFSKVGIYINRYWQLESNPHSHSLDETREMIRYLVEDSVNRQMVADVPVCTFLSGGLDSSTLSALAAKYYRGQNKQLKTFSIDYKDNNKYFEKSLFQPNADSEYVEQMSEHIGSDHYNYVCDTPMLLRSLKPALDARDLPGMADVDSSLMLFCEEVKKQATVALSGECADEIFGGYPWFTNPDMLRLDIFPWANSLVLRKIVLSDELKSLPIEDYAKDAFKKTCDETPLLLNETKEENLRRKMFYLNMKWFMTNLLERKDRMSMACGLEVRVPFCDHRIAQYAWNIPWEIKCLNGQEKGILRNAVSDLLPKAIVNRKKSPYPKTHNPTYDTGVRRMLKSILDNKSSRLHEVLDIKYIYDILNGGANIKTPWFGQLMKGPQLFAFLIQLEYWMKDYKINFV